MTTMPQFSSLRSSNSDRSCRSSSKVALAGRPRLHALALGLLVLGCVGSAKPARADIWGYVDETGRAHMASEKIDSRYQLFFKGTTRVGSPQVMKGAASVAAPAPAPAPENTVAAKAADTISGSTIGIRAVPL